MLLLLIVLIFLAASVFVFTPLIWLILGKVFKIENMTFKKALVTCLILSLIGIVFQIIPMGLTYFRLNSIVFDLILSISGLILAILIIKTSFKTTAMKSIGLHISTIIIAVIIALTIRTYAVQAFKIPSGSMNHTIFVGDYILVNKCLYSYNNPERGDIIVFRYPKDRNKDFIMRIIAAGGDKIEIVDKQVLINNRKIDEPYKFHEDQNIYPQSYQPRDNLAAITVPDNAFFVMGDNRDRSNDSRYWGLVERGLIKGKAFNIYWSWDKESESVRWDRIGKDL
jgi:signal peptidase I